MLAESCPQPGCPGIPLMRKKGTTVGLCVLCNADAVNGGVGAPATPVPAPATVRSPAPTAEDLARLRAAAAARAEASPPLLSPDPKAPSPGSAVAAKVSELPFAYKVSS
jgi:uncharacterized Zn finger protein (UPF0148 family)